MKQVKVILRNIQKELTALDDKGALILCQAISSKVSDEDFNKFSDLFISAFEKIDMSQKNMAMKIVNQLGILRDLSKENEKVGDSIANFIEIMFSKESNKFYEAKNSPLHEIRR